MNPLLSMPHITELHGGSFRVLDYRCCASADSQPYWESHVFHSISYVRRGTFSCECQGRIHEFIPGAIFVGKSGDEFRCSHDHHRGADECLSFQLAKEAVEEIAPTFRGWNTVQVPPLQELVVLGELAQLAADARCDLAVDEAGMLFVARVVDLVSDTRRPKVTVRAVDRRRMVEAALRVDQQAHKPLTLERVARDVGVTPYHFLRLFKAVLNITPHQYLLRARLRRAARLLVDSELSVTEVASEVGFLDLSNFVRRFHQAAGASPSRFRKLARHDRKNFQVFPLNRT